MKKRKCGSKTGDNISNVFNQRTWDQCPFDRGFVNHDGDEEDDGEDDDEDDDDDDEDDDGDDDDCDDDGMFIKREEYGKGWGVLMRHFVST